MTSQTRRKRRANTTRLRLEKVTRPRLRSYVQRVVILRPLSILVVVLPTAAAIVWGGPGIIGLAAVFSTLTAAMFWASTTHRCPVCRTPLEAEPAGQWVGMPARVACTRCRVQWRRDR